MINRKYSWHTALQKLCSPVQRMLWGGLLQRHANQALWPRRQIQPKKLRHHPFAHIQLSRSKKQPHHQCHYPGHGYQLESLSDV